MSQGPATPAQHLRCLTCGTVYDEPVNGQPVQFCPKDRTRLDRVPGEVIIDGKFLMGALLGRGGMGEIYEARQLKLRRLVAVKLMKPELSSTAELIRRFEEEAHLAANISHDNVVTIYDLGRLSDGRLYIAMERLQGVSLTQRLSQRERLPPEEALPLWLQMLLGMAAAHNTGVVHRDLKPDNVFLQQRPGEPERVKIIDFGMARQETGLGHGTQPGMGTLAYMAPEQLDPPPARPAAAGPLFATDVYASGLILYEMLSGRLPWGTSPNELTPLQAMERLWKLPIPLSRLYPDLRFPQAALEGLLQDVLATDPKARPENAGRVLERARRLLEEHPLSGWCLLPVSVFRPADSEEDRTESVNRVAAGPAEPPAPATCPLPVAPPAPATLSSPVETATLPPPGPEAAAPGIQDPTPPPRRLRWRLIAAGAAVVGGLALLATFWTPSDTRQAEDLSSAPVLADLGSGLESRPDLATPPAPAGLGAGAGAKGRPDLATPNPPVPVTQPPFKREVRVNLKTNRSSPEDPTPRLIDFKRELRVHLKTNPSGDLQITVLSGKAQVRPGGDILCTEGQLVKLSLGLSGYKTKTVVFTCGKPVQDAPVQLKRGLGQEAGEAPLN